MEEIRNLKRGIVSRTQRYSVRLLSEVSVKKHLASILTQGNNSKPSRHETSVAYLRIFNTFYSCRHSSGFTPDSFFIHTSETEMLRKGNMK